jgi:uncharacterized RDD family membrane protein YckC
MSYPPPPAGDPYSNQQQGQAYGQPAYGQAPYGQPAAAYAGWGTRFVAYLIDSLVFVPFLGLGFVLGMSTDEATGLQTPNALFFILYLLGIVVLAYNRWYLAGKTGQSWGRKAMGIRLLGEQTGQPIGGGMAFVRDLAHNIDTWACLVGWLFPLWDAKKQTFADKIVKTLVVR